MKKTDQLSKTRGQVTWQRRITTWLGSRWFFVAILSLFVAEALWIACSGRYPMAFDEDFHLGIIKVYAHHLSPFFMSQPPGADQFGAVARDPSYLYHWLMSFPWRLITVFTHNQMTQVIIMRTLNIGLFAGALVLFRKLLAKTKFSAALINVSFFFFILTPLVPQVAAQINYDNLFMLVVPLALLLAVNFKERLERGQFDWPRLALLLAVCFLGSLVKYPFLPIFAGIVLWLSWHVYKLWRVDHSFARLMRSGYIKLNKSAKVLVVLAILISGGLFFERYGINTLRYGTPTPECNQVLNIQQCSAYGSWARNYRYEQAKPAHIDANPVSFGFTWAKIEGFNLMFALNGPASGYGVGYPLTLPRIVARTVAYISPLLLLLYWKKMFASRTARLIGLVAVLYLAALWLQNYTDYLHLGHQVGIQGRYLLPVLLPVYVMVAVGFARLLKRLPQLKMTLLAVATICFILGGGVLTFIMQSDPSWYWPNPTVVRANQDVQNWLRPIIPGV